MAICSVVVRLAADYLLVARIIDRAVQVSALAVVLGGAFARVGRRPCDHPHRRRRNVIREVLYPRIVAL
jgi:hypothetical protein